MEQIGWSTNLVYCSDKLTPVFIVLAGVLLVAGILMTPLQAAA